MVDTALSQAPGTEQQVLHDTRAVLDASELGAVRATAGQTWAVLRTTPGPNSGSGTIPGAFVDGSTGRIIDSATGAEVGPDTQPVAVYTGSYQVLAILSGQLQAGDYAWQEPLAVEVRDLPRESVYHPFALPGTVVARYRPEATDAAPFDPVYLIPDGWETHVPAAVAETSVVDSANPLLAARALTALARDKSLDEPTLRARLDRTDGYPRALTHFVALRDAGHLGGAALWAALATDLADPEPDHRRAAALGLLTARLFAPEATRAAIGDRLPDPASATDDTYLGVILALLNPR